jgi:hypothetical protein
MSYPTLRLGVLQGLATLKVACDAEQGYLRRPDCPYDNDTIELLEKLFKPVEVEVIVEKIVEKPSRGKVGRPSKKNELSEDDANELEIEAKEMLTELRNMAKTEEGDLKQLDTGTRLSILKTRTQLLEKLVSIRERFTSARKVIEFRSTVMGILEDLVPEEKRDEFLKRLEEHLD